jgi:hypothetical protein
MKHYCAMVLDKESREFLGTAVLFVQQPVHTDQHLRDDLNNAATATAVVSALVSSSSFLGQAGEIGADVTNPLIRMSIVCNNLSFYLSIASVMLSLVPALPVPKEGLLYGPTNELKRSRKVIIAAIATLFIAIICQVITFLASSLAGIPFELLGLVACSTFIGGLVCCLVFFFFSLSFLRLIFPRNALIKRLYQLK